MSSASEAHEPITVTDKRRVDPKTGQVREGTSGPAPGGPASEDFAGETPEEAGKAAELIADLQRVQADFANYRKRALRDQKVFAERSKAAVVSQLLPVLDDLERARSHGDLESGPLRAVADKLVKVLEGFGLSAFGDEGDEFDPALHEAVQHEGDGSNPVIGSVLRRGYRLGDQILRHAMVGVVDTVPESDDVDEVADTPSDTEEADEEPAKSES